MLDLEQIKSGTEAQRHTGDILTQRVMGCASLFGGTGSVLHMFFKLCTENNMPVAKMKIYCENAFLNSHGSNVIIKNIYITCFTYLLS